MKRYQMAGAAACGVLIFMTVLTLVFNGTEAGVPPAAPLLAKAAPALVEPAPEPAAEAEASLFQETANPAPEFDAEGHRQVAVARLNELFGQHIYHVRVQIQAIEKLTHYLKEVYPDTWQDHVYAYLSSAFPDHVAQIYDNYLRLMDFKQWGKDNAELLLGMTAEERKKLIRARRQQFFGNDAQVIWEKELKAEAVARSLEDLNRQKEMAFHEKVNFYMASLDDVYGDRAEAFRQAYTQKAMDQFLETEVVQADLAAMAPEDRQAHLNFFRANMGLDDAALERWAQLDTERDARWEKGRAYMAARRQVAAASGVPGREHLLDELRQDYFGAEAEVIKQEEQTGLFRFGRERIYGKN
ncbi:hypothetical protein [Desulfosudis oleivorans]|uniref:Lipase helper protein n=1 Tax=Desulfosudis oleivorans (strain DSM 6200 / JCM 39069 / Hxd3) TaxID=96561 RepID=A8ZWF0_DESOH|nr:hypothetical protein [Desulfosudis oleivorans]ABW66758.1 conserved hypothetical protein [Desulfosudis oleivorans Hxd3]